MRLDTPGVGGDGLCDACPLRIGLTSDDVQLGLIGAYSDAAAAPAPTITPTPPETQTPVPTPTDEPTATPLASVGALSINRSQVPRRSVADVDVALTLLPGVEVAGARIDILHGRGVVPLVLDNGRPDCTVSPEINKEGTAFAFRPPGCTPGSTCSSVRALVLALDNVDPIPSGSTLFTCRFVVAGNAGDFILLSCANQGGDGTDGSSRPLDCIDGGIDVVEEAPPFTSTPTASPFPTRTPACAGDSSCDDGNPCTEDRCNPLFGCIRSPVSAPCDDGVACSQPDFCSGTVCTSGGGPDEDADGVCALDDNCVDVANPDQANADGDRFGDACDNCADVVNDQQNLDGDALGDACDPDRDGDGTPDETDNCPSTNSPDQSDRDGDAVGDACDNCPDQRNPDQSNHDSDALGDACDLDDDGDDVRDAADDCPLAFDPEQLDSDEDGLGDACDTRPFGGREPPIRAVALSGQAAPGAGPGVSFSSLQMPLSSGGPLIDRNGRVAFRAELGGPGVRFEGGEAGIWVGRGTNGLSKVVRERDAVNGAEASCFVAFPDRAALGESGHLAFACEHATTGGLVETSLWVLPPGGEPVEIARDGMPAPGTEEGTVFSLDFAAPSVGPDGRVSFIARAVGPNVAVEQERGVWAGRSASSLGIVVRGGTPAPGASGGRFTDFGAFGATPGTPMSTASGGIVFAALVNGSEPEGSGIWSAGAAGIRKIARNGDPATGLPLTRFEEILGPFSAAGERVAFSAQLPNFSFGIWSHEPEAGLTLVAASGIAAPGLDDEDAVFGTDFGYPVLNAQGVVAFRAGTGNGGFGGTQGIWTFDPRGGVRIAVHGGQQVPSTEEGVEFDDFSFNFDAIALNARRQLAFRAFLDGGSEGLFVFEPGRGLLLVARSRGLMQVGAGDLREVSGLSLVPGSAAEDGLGCGINDRGEVAFAASFSDGSSGVFVARTGPLPCPGDCDDDGTVRIDELVRSVRVAVRGADVFDCGAVDTDEDGAAGIDELIGAVNASLYGCSR